MRKTQFHGLNQNAIKWLNKNCDKKTTIPDCRKQLSDALNEFRKQYPSIKSGDLQTFTLGYKACIDDFLTKSEFDTKDLRVITGMFDEDVHTLKQYKLSNGNGFVEEYVQSSEWNSGPVILLALRFSDSKKPVKASLWETE